MIDFLQLRKSLEARKSNPKAEIPQVRAVTSERATVVDAEKRILRFVASDESWDRCGTLIRSTGWDFENYLKNPVFLWCHQHEGLPLGQAQKVSVINKRLIMDIQFASPEEYPFAETVYKLYLGGFLRANSVGMYPMEWNLIGEGESVGIEFTRQELIEDSACPVPANPNALVLAVGAGDLTRQQAADYTARMIYDGHLDSPDGREALSESIRRLADDPDFESKTILALRSLGAKRPVRNSASQPAIQANNDWDAPLSELRAMNQTQPS